MNTSKRARMHAHALVQCDCVACISAKNVHRFIHVCVYTHMYIL